MINSKGRKLLLITLIFSFQVGFVKADVSPIKVSPVIIDQQAKPRDVLEYKITLTNDTSNRASLYALVEDVSVKNGQQQIVDLISLDKTISLVRWLQINRSRILIAPHQQISVPLKIEIDPQAKSGKYYALITFSPGSSKPQAEENAKKFKQPQVLVGIQVTKNKLDRLQLNEFKNKKNIYFNSPASFYIELKNIGNQLEKPTGEIIIYNKKLETIKEISLANKFKPIEPGKKEKIILTWPFENAGVGRYKARLYISYGQNNNKDLNDSLYFFIIPIKFIIITIGGIIFTLLFLLIILFEIFKNKFLKETTNSKKQNLKHKKQDIDLTQFK